MVRKLPKGPPSNISDEDLFRQYQRTKEGYYIGELYKRYSHLIFGLCLKYTKDRDASQDMVMTIFEQLMQKLPTIEVNSFNKWIYIYARNICVSELRKQNVQQNVEEEVLEEVKHRLTENVIENEGYTKLNNHRVDKELAIESKQVKEKAVLEKAMKKLNKEQRRCVQLFFLEKRSYRQIVDDTKYSLKEVKSHLQNGKRNLKKMMSQQMAG